MYCKTETIARICNDDDSGERELVHRFVLVNWRLKTRMSVVISPECARDGCQSGDKSYRILSLDI